jgi:hypothetical protein
MDVGDGEWERVSVPSEADGERRRRFKQILRGGCCGTKGRQGSHFATRTICSAMA